MDNKKPRHLKPGDIFWEKYNGKYFFARLLIDMKVPISKKELNPQGIMASFIEAGFYYIEIYKGIFDKPELTTGIPFFNAFFMPAFLHSKNAEVEDWGWYSNIPVDYTKIDFPETISKYGGYLYFQKGELSFKTKFKDDLFEELKVKGVTRFGFSPFIDIMLLELNRKDLIMEDVEYIRPLKYQDIRFNPELRKKMYDSIGEAPNLSYFDLALKHGNDLRRFFNN